jgi:hypothetical protein
MVQNAGMRIHHRGTEEDEGAQREEIFPFCESKKRNLLPLCPLILLCASVVNLCSSV